MAGRSVQEIRGGRVDAGLLTLPVEESDMVTVPVLREELLVVTIPTHQLAKTAEGSRPRPSPACPFVLFETGSATRKVIDHFFASEKIEPDHRDGDGERGNHQGDGQNGPGHRDRAVSGRRPRGAGEAVFSAPGSKGTSCGGRPAGFYARANRVPRIIDELLAAFEAIHGKLRLSPRRRGDGVVG